MREIGISQKHTYYRGKAKGTVEGCLLHIAARFEEPDFKWLQDQAKLLGVSTAEVIRRCVKAERKKHGDVNGGAK